MITQWNLSPWRQDVKQKQVFFFFPDSAVFNDAVPVSVFRDRRIGASRERQHICARAVTPLSWPGWRERGEREVARDGWHTPASGTPFYPRSHFLFQHKLAVEHEPTVLRVCYVNFVNFNTPSLPLQQYGCVWPRICNLLHVLVKLLVVC